MADHPTFDERRAQHPAAPSNPVIFLDHDGPTYYNDEFDAQERAAEAALVQQLVARGVPRTQIVTTLDLAIDGDAAGAVRTFVNHPDDHIGVLGFNAGLHDADHMQLHYTKELPDHPAYAVGYDMVGATFHLEPRTNGLHVTFTLDADHDQLADHIIEHVTEFNMFTLFT